MVLLCESIKAKIAVGILNRCPGFDPALAKILPSVRV